MSETTLAGAALAIVLFLLCTLLHFNALRACNSWLVRLRSAQVSGVMLAVIVAFASHMAQIGLFAAAYAALIHLGLGSLRGLDRPSALGLLYFSTETYSSLGFGDLLPRGALRMLAGIEAIVGLVMVAWTASFTFLEMSRHWRISSGTLSREPETPPPHRGRQLEVVPSRKGAPK